MSLNSQVRLVYQIFCLPEPFTIGQTIFYNNTWVLVETAMILVYFIITNLTIIFQETAHVTIILVHAILFWRKKTCYKISLAL
jgi:hypothetical protein